MDPQTRMIVVYVLFFIAAIAAVMIGKSLSGWGRGEDRNGTPAASGSAAGVDQEALPEGAELDRLILEREEKALECLKERGVRPELLGDVLQTLRDEGDSTKDKLYYARYLGEAIRRHDAWMASRASDAA